MREEDALFTLYKRGWQSNIVPRGRAGWLAICAWVAALLPCVGLFSWAMASHPTRAQTISATLLFLMVVAAWTVGLIQWSRSRSVVVDLDKAPPRDAVAPPAPRDPNAPAPWFAAKSFGYGTGLPIAWQGWALIAAWLGLLGGVALLDRSGNDAARVAAFALLLAGTATFLSVAAKRTEGGWRWRWGRFPGTGKDGRGD